jgi:DMSO reductase family type II enzyme chaperone
VSPSSVNVADSSPNLGVAADLVRSDVYAYLSRAFSFPDASLHAQVTEGPLVEHLAAALSRLPYRLKLSDLDWRTPATFEDLQTEYIRLFQIGGRRGPPCSLHAGFYGRDRSRTLQHLIRFYNFFGFKLNECVMPDQICVQLDFMSILAKGDVADRDSALRAQRDFLKGQLMWTVTVAERVHACKPVPLYGSLASLTARLVQADGAFIERAITAGASHERN